MQWTKLLNIPLVVLNVFIYALIAYTINRAEFYELISIYGILFIFYLWFIQHNKEFTLSNIILIGITFRLVFLFSIPALSDDYFRFIWDGILNLNGENPYLKYPFEFKPILKDFGLTRELFDNLNSKRYYSVYPPFSQLIYTISSFLSFGNFQGNILIMRCFILFAEIGTLFLIGKIVLTKNKVHLPLMLYSFNPLVIIEFTGNLHFEVFMIFFIVLGIYYFQKENWWFASIAFSLAILTKLTPLMLLPLFLLKHKNFTLKKFIPILLGVSIVGFIPYISFEFLEHFWESLQLYYQTFEFNASIYYLIRWVGYSVAGFNIIALAGKLMFLTSFLFILYLAYSWKKRPIEETILLTYFVFLLFSTTVHPWYFIPLFFISIFTRYRFALIWSALIIVTYITYQTKEYQENHWLIATEYIIVITYFILEHFRKIKLKMKRTLKSLNISINES